MKFCPKCGSLMVPIREGDKRFFKCAKCGYLSEQVKESEYKLKEGIDKKARVRTTSVVSKGTPLAISMEEREQRVEEYYEIALEMIQEELEGEAEEE